MSGMDDDQYAEAKAAMIDDFALRIRARMEDSGDTSMTAFFNVTTKLLAEIRVELDDTRKKLEQAHKNIATHEKQISDMALPYASTDKTLPYPEPD